MKAMTSPNDGHGAGSLGPQVAVPTLLGEALVQDAGLSRADLNRALAAARARNIRLGTALIELGLFSADDIAVVLAQQHGVASVRDKHLEAIDPQTRAMIPPAIEERLGAVAVAITRSDPPRLVVAMRDPRDARAITALERASGLAVMPAVAAVSRLEAIIRDATASQLAALIRDAVPPRPTGIPLTGASPLLDLDALPQRATPWNAAARALALEARKRARAPGPSSPAPGSVSQAAPARGAIEMARGTQPPPVAETPRYTTLPPIASAPSSVAAAPVRGASRRVAVAVLVLVLVGVIGYLGYVGFR